MPHLARLAVLAYATLALAQVWTIQTVAIAAAIMWVAAAIIKITRQEDQP